MHNERQSLKSSLMLIVKRKIDSPCFCGFVLANAVSQLTSPVNERKRKVAITSYP